MKLFDVFFNEETAMEMHPPTCVEVIELPTEFQILIQFTCTCTSVAYQYMHGHNLW